MFSQIDYSRPSAPAQVFGDLAYDTSTLVSYGVVFFLVQLTIKNALLAANMVGERDGHSFDHLRMVLVVLLAILGVALIVALVLKASFDNNNYASVFLMALAAAMTGAVILILRFLFRVCCLSLERVLAWP